MTTPQTTQPITPSSSTESTEFTAPTGSTSIISPIEPVSQKKSPLVAILLTLLVLATTAAAYFYFRTSKADPPLADTTQSQPTASAIASASADPTADWQTYTNSKYNFSIKIPQEATVSDPQDDLNKGHISVNNTVSLFFDNRRNSELSYIESQSDNLIEFQPKELPTLNLLNQDYSVTRIVFGSGTSDDRFPNCSNIASASTYYIDQGEVLISISTKSESSCDDNGNIQETSNFEQNIALGKAILQTLQFIDQTQEEVNNMGTVNGKLCYGSDYLPPGEIATKNISTGQIFSQPFLGSRNNDQYSIKLPIGTYNIRYQAHASASKPDLYTSGYYTSCGLDSAHDNCIQPNSHDLIPIVVTKDQAISNINLCDFGFSQEDEQLLEASF